MRIAFVRIIFLSVVLVGWLALARADTSWGEPPFNFPFPSDNACVDKTGTGTVGICDKKVGDQFELKNFTVQGKQAQCAEVTDTFSWGWCNGTKLGDGQPRCAFNYKPCLEAKFYSQKTLQGGVYVCAGTVLLDGNQNPIFQKLYVSNACDINPPNDESPGGP